MQNERDIMPITLEELFRMQYVQEEILPAAADQRVRKVNLDKAITLGKSVKKKTDLIIFTITGYKKVSAIVRLFNEKGITIEHDHFIPMHAIYSVNFR